MSTSTAFSSWFHKLTGCAPHAWQRVLGDDPHCRDRFIRIPTGFGKTAGAILPWLYHRVVLDNAQWPTRLVFCLPMRVLVEQTEAEITRFLRGAGVSIDVHVLMGGRTADRWELLPEVPAVLVGTQDMLFSRALHRGFAMGRARWPMSFGLLHHDSLWILDEVQLMDTALATSTQLSAFRAADAKRNGTFPPSFTWWMSATLQPAWFETVDHLDRARQLGQQTVRIAATERRGGAWEIRKTIERSSDIVRPDQIAELALKHHRPGKLTLVVQNRVDRAVELFQAIADARFEGKGKNRRAREDRAGIDVRLVHSRFRGAERSAWRAILHRHAEIPPAGRVIVATQVIEAGVDISAHALITELAPWTSLVQRFGRCARYANDPIGHIIVVGIPADSLPYTLKELGAADDALERMLHDPNPDASPRGIETFEELLAETDSLFFERLYPYEAEHVLRRRDIDELFDTTPDLTGADLDVSRYIRSGDERDVRVFWRHIDKGERLPKALSRADVPPATRDELCPVPVRDLRDFLRADTSRLAFAMDYLHGEWRRVDLHRLRPGLTILMDAASGGYHPARGWDSKSKEPVVPVPIEPMVDTADTKLEAASAAEQDDRLSMAAKWKTIATHGKETAEVVVTLARSIGLDDRYVNILDLAARWHDAGKAHDTFQAAIGVRAREIGAPMGQRRDLAKAPDGAWMRPPYAKRPGFRHELVSTLGLFECLRRVNPRHEALLGPHVELLRAMGDEPVIVPDDERIEPSHPLARELADLSASDFNLVAWLVCSHHGKVRCAWTSTPHDQQEGHDAIFGVIDCDTIPPLALWAKDSGRTELPELSLSLEPAAMGIGRRYGASWGERVQSLLAEFGPFQLTFLEALLRAADARATQLDTEDSVE